MSYTIEQKRQIAKEFDNSWEIICNNGENKTLDKIWSSLTMSYFSQFKTDVLHILKQNATNPEDDQRHINPKQKLLDENTYKEFNTKSVQDFSFETTSQVLIQFDYFRGELENEIWQIDKHKYIKQIKRYNNRKASNLF